MSGFSTLYRPFLATIYLSNKYEEGDTALADSSNTGIYDKLEHAFLSTAQTVEGAIKYAPTDPSLAVGNDPATVIAGKSGTGSKTLLTYPPDRPPYYFMIRIYEYKRLSWNEVATRSLQASVVLPIPMNLLDAQSVDWEGENLGIAGAIAAGVFGGNGMRGAEQAGVAALADVASGVTKEGLGQLGGSTVSTTLSMTGVAINNYMTMMLRGPQYKEHSFAWVFSPETVEETNEIAAIYRLVSASQAVSMKDSGTSGSAFFSYPSVFQLSFCHDALASAGNLGKLLYKMKPSILKSAVWNFAPNGAPAFFAASKGPQSIALQLNFAEIEFWTRDDYVALASSTSEAMP